MGDAAFTQLEEMFILGLLISSFYQVKPIQTLTEGCRLKKNIYIILYIYIGTGLETTKKSMK